MYQPVNMLMKVLPYSLWLVYDLKNINSIKKFIPDEMRIQPVKMFKSDTLG